MGTVLYCLACYFGEGICPSHPQVPSTGRRSQSIGSVTDLCLEMVNIHLRYPVPSALFGCIRCIPCLAALVRVHSLETPVELFAPGRTHSTDQDEFPSLSEVAPHLACPFPSHSTGGTRQTGVLPLGLVTGQSGPHRRSVSSWVAATTGRPSG